MESADARDVKRRMKSLGKHIGELILGSDSDELDMTHLHGLMSVVLPDVDVLSSLSATNDVVSPFDTRRVVLEYGSWFRWREPKIAKEVPEIDCL